MIQEKKFTALMAQVDNRCLMMLMSSGLKAQIDNFELKFSHVQD